MIKSTARCSVCGQIGDRDEMILYNFPSGPKLVCKRCYRQLPREPGKDIILPDERKRRKPNDEFFPPVD